MKNSFFVIFLFICFSAVAQEQDTIPPPTEPVIDTTEVITDSLQTIPTEDSTMVSADTIVQEEKDSLAQLAIAYEKIRQLEAQLDSLKSINHRLAQTAKRRLTIDMFQDSFRSFRFYACTVDPEKIDIQLFNQKEGKKGVHTFESIASLAEKRKQKLIFAMNGGMFEPNRKAKGLLVINGEQKQQLDTLTAGYGNFYMQPNGVFAIDSTNKAYVISTQDYQYLADTVPMQWATQSGPMLLRKGQMNALFNDGSPNRHIRNAVGVTPNNELVFVISERPVTFFELTSFMIKQGCTDALYLDGAISQGYFADLAIGQIKNGNRLGPIIAIMK